MRRWKKEQRKVEERQRCAGQDALFTCGCVCCSVECAPFSLLFAAILLLLFFVRFFFVDVFVLRTKGCTRAGVGVGAFFFSVKCVSLCGRNFQEPVPAEGGKALLRRDAPTQTMASEEHRKRKRETKKMEYPKRGKGCNHTHAHTHTHTHALANAQNRQRRVR